MGASGIIWMGPAYDRAGYGAVCRNYVLGLARIGFPVRLLPLGPEHPEIDSEALAELRSLETAPVGSAPVLVAHWNADLFARVPRLGLTRRIGCTIFETDRIPPAWVGPCNRMDEVWVPSEFNRQTFAASGVDPDRLVVVPYGIDTSAYEPREPLPRHEGPFTFLYVCVFGWRKGIDLLLEAFLNEFDRGEARLVVRAYTAGEQGIAKEELGRVLLESVADRVRSEGRELPDVEILTDALSPAELIALYRSADLYISTDRANGWGMPCQEAMALGVPAATIDWSGSTEFMTEHNSVLIHPTGDLEPVDPRLQAALPQLYAGHRWAKVEPEEVRRAMRWAREHPGELAALARAGKEYVRSELSIEAVARRIAARVSSFEPTVAQRASGGARTYLPWVAAVRGRRRMKLAREAA